LLVAMLDPMPPPRKAAAMAPLIVPIRFSFDIEQPRVASKQQLRTAEQQRAANMDRFDVSCEFPRELNGGSDAAWFGAFQALAVVDNGVCTSSPAAKRNELYGL
jgi:hypothetical protein